MADGRERARGSAKRLVAPLVVGLQLVWLLLVVVPAIGSAPRVEAYPVQGQFGGSGTGCDGEGEGGCDIEEFEDPEEDQECPDVQQAPDEQECNIGPPRSSMPVFTGPSTASTPPPQVVVSDTTPPTSQSQAPPATPAATPGASEPKAEPQLEVAQPSVFPGGRTTVTGHGCTPGSAVQLSIDGDAVGTAKADDDGSFETELDVPELGVGRYELQARCGPTITAPLDIVLTSTSQASTWTLGVLVFFVLGGLVVSRGRAA